MKIAYAGGEATASLRPRRALIRAHFVAVIALVVAVVPPKAEGQEDKYLRIYEKVEQADALEAGGKTAAALAKYQEAHSDLLQLRRDFPSWKRQMVSLRLNYVAGKAAACDDKLKPAAAGASSSTQSATQEQVAIKAPATRPPRPGEPTVTLLEAGAEPRKVLRLQPEAGDKQIVVLTMQTGMEPGPFSNLPPVAETMEIRIKKVFPGGDIVYEGVITNVSVLAGSRATGQVPKDFEAAFSSVKGVITSGVMSSRGFSRRRETGYPGSNKALPAIVRLSHGLMYTSLDTMVLPEEAVGTGGKWEVKPAERSRDGPERAVYEVVSMEKDGVTVKTTSTVSAAKPKAKDSAATGGGGSGEMTIDLARIMPTKGNLVYRMEASGPELPGGMKMWMDLRIEAK